MDESDLVALLAACTALVGALVRLVAAYRGWPDDSEDGACG